MLSKNFYTIFPRTENVHLIKDVGMVPYILYKYNNYSSIIATYKNSDSYNYLENEVKGVEINFIKKRFKNRNYDILWYLLKNFRKIDIIQFYHFEIDYLDVIGIYKILRKLFFKSSFAYIKCDGSSRFVNTNIDTVKLSWLRKKIMNSVDLYTVETTKDYNIIKNLECYNKINIKLMPNGFYDKGIKINLENTPKEKIILTVGRLGTYQKNTEFLLEAFKKSEIFKTGWKLHLIGTIEKGFEKKIDEFYNENPNLHGSVQFFGSINNRDVLKNHYLMSSVFIMTSRDESGPLVAPEALSAGCHVLLSDPINLKDDISINHDYGQYFSIESTKDLIAIFRGLNEFNFEKIKYSIQEFAYEKFYWPNVLKVVDEEIKGK